jgi:TP901 family phage tail tape measure protein
MSSAGGVRAGKTFVEIFAKDTEFQRGMNRVQTRLNNIGSAMQSFGTKMMLAGTAVGLPLLLAARQAAGFEDALLGMSAAAGLAGDQVAQMEAEAMRLSKTMGVSPSKIANAMLELAKAGMDVEDVLGGAAEAAVQFARVSGVEMADAAVFMKTAMNSFGVSATEAVDTLSAAADASETSILAMVESFALVGSAGALFNQSLFDVSQGLALLARFGIRGEEAGTGIKTMLVRLTSPSKEARDALERIGLTMGDFRDQAGKLLPIAQIVGVLERALKGVDKMAQDEILTTVFGDRGIRVIGGFLQVGTHGFDTMADAMESNLPVAAKFAILMSGLSGAFEKLRGAAERMAIAFAKTLGDGAARAAAAIAWMMDAISALMIQFPRISQAVVGVTAALLAVGAAAIVVGIAFKVLAAAVAVLAFAFTPVGSAVIAATATLAVFAQKMYALSPAFRGEVDAILAAAQRLDFSSAWEIMNLNLAIALTQMDQYFGGFFLSIQNAATGAGFAIYDAIAGPIDRLLVYATNLADRMAGIFSATQEAFSGGGLGYTGLAGAMAAGLAQTFGRSDEDVQRSMEETQADIQATFDREKKRNADLAEREQARKNRAGQRQAQGDGTLEDLRRRLDEAKKAAAREADGSTAAKRSEKRKEGFPMPPEPPEDPKEPKAGKEPKPPTPSTLSTFAAEIAGQIGVGPELDYAQQTANNTARAADALDRILNVGDFGKGGIKAFDPAGIQQALASAQRDVSAPVAGGDKDLLSANEKTAAASERMAATLDRMARSMGGGGLAFA